MKRADFYRQTAFFTSASNISNAPADEGMEIAFAGRSNAGKSSAINALCGQKSLARTSRTPGRTQLINFFSLDEQRKLVDLPGYGFAKVSLVVKNEWQRSLSEYLEKRESLRGIIMMMDVRHPMKEFDCKMLEWCEGRGLQVHILLTKADKLKRGPATSTLQQLRKSVAKYDVKITAQLFSALKRTGLEEAYEILDQWFDRAES